MRSLRRAILGADYGVLDGVCLLVYANKLDLDMNQPLDVNEVWVPAALRMLVMTTTKRKIRWVCLCGTVHLPVPDCPTPCDALNGFQSEAPTPCAPFSNALEAGPGN